MRTAVLIPALNEEASIGLVLAEIPEGLVERVVVVDNGSTDRTADVARDAGAQVVREDRRGYGYACLRGMRELRDDPPDVVVFLDGDHSDFPEQMGRLLAPIRQGAAHFVVGSRMTGKREAGALLPQARFGNTLASLLMRLGWGVRYTDLGPFRAITWRALARLRMRDGTYGWTIEMQLKAAEAGLAYAEVPVDYRRRIGVSKVTGTVRGTVMASAKILWTLARYAATKGSREYGETDTQGDGFP